MKAYQFRIEIKNSKPPIWRRCIVPAGVTFSQLSLIFDIVMGWSGYHLSRFEFYHLGLQLEEEDELFDFLPRGDFSLLVSSKTYINEYMERESWFTYTYDFGDYWDHRVTIEKIIIDYPNNYPIVTKYKGDCPIEDSGGIQGYYQCLEIMADEEHPEHEERRKWADMQGYSRYNIDEVNNELKTTCFINYGRADRRKKHEIATDFFNNKPGLLASKTARNKMQPIKPSQDSREVVKTPLDKEIDKLLKSEELNEKITCIKASGLSSVEIDKAIGLEVNEALSRLLIGEEFLQGTYLIDILNLYTKTELKDIADIFKMTKVSSLRKGDLVKVTSEKMLTPEVLRDAFLKLNDDELHAFEKATAYTIGYPINEGDISLYLELYDMGYIFINADNKVTIPLDVIEVYNQINNEEFRTKRKRISWLLSCFEVAARLYGVAPINIMVKLYNQRKGMRTDRQTLLSDFEQIPSMYNEFELLENRFIYLELFDNYNHYTKLLKRQGDKEYYIPTENEIVDISLYGFILRNPYVAEFISFFIHHNNLLEEEALIMASITNEMINSDGQISDVFDLINNKGYTFNKEEDLKAFIPILNNLWNNTRILYNRGHTPAEIFNKEKHLYGVTRPMPTVVPGSSNAAKLLMEGEEEIKRMGFSIDFDSNADEIPVYSMPTGIGGAIKKETKKIYPNDPCPCGSGKKYKRCCGRD